MFRRIVRGRAPSLLTVAATLVAVASGCGTKVKIAETKEQGPPSFSAPDAGGEDASVDVRPYCPSNKCPVGRTTCPASRFFCDVDLLSDRLNCGACGNACPAPGYSSSESYECIDGQCVMSCRAEAFDCDGAVDNGCEVSASDENCGGCGIRCTDPAKPCIPEKGVPACGCSAGKLFCGWAAAIAAKQYCFDPETDDRHCGGCENACPREGGPDAEPPPTNMYYGCLKGECGAPKCKSGYADCDGQRDNGCEVDLATNDDCGSCGNACPDGTKCVSDGVTMFCACPGSLAFCPTLCVGDDCLGSCIDLSSDPDHCGGCNIGCPADVPNGAATCSYGACTFVCNAGRADCNGSRHDGCEIDTNSDPRHCGGCGNACDGVEGQACVNGRCVVEPCDTGDGGVVPR